MNTEASNANKATRLHWLDNLRTFTIFLVVLYHVGGVYEAAGLWGSFWIVDDPSTITWVGIIGIIFDIMVMPTMFFIAGYLISPSLNSKTPLAFLKSKIRRLLLPWLLAVLTLIPLYKVIFLYSRGLPQEVWTNYFHFNNPNSQNWLWFLPVLFLFNVIYLLFSSTKFKRPVIPVKSWLWVVLFIGFVYSYSIGGWLGMRSWTLTPLLDFENERLLIYFMAFLLGAGSFKQGLFTNNPPKKLLYNITNGIAWIPVTLHIFARLYPFFYPENFSTTPMYRSIWWLSFDLSLLAMMYLMLGTFWRYFNKPSKLWVQLNQNSYGVYIIHVIMIGIFGTLLLNSGFPALVKYPALIVLTYTFSNLAVMGYHQARKWVSGKNYG
ncbi:MAG: acyltransferase family protein [Candidatus Marinimicrobia bacterium]|nr:acyltransferase family protein [Candidatus Neomarinimicrobiota bacterium]